MTTRASSSTRAHAIRSLCLIAALYIMARTLRWIGPDSAVEWMPELMWPAIGIITLWGIARMTRRW